MIEIWKDISGFEGYYQVSNTGKVKSLSRVVKRKGQGDLPLKERILKPGTDATGYLFVILQNGSKKSLIKIHQLSYQEFKGELIDGLVINHIDHNILNNHPDNLELISRRENNSHGSLFRNTTSKYIGVSWSKRYQKWVSQIYINGRQTGLGKFINEIDAHNAYQLALIEHQIQNKYARN